MWLCRDFSGIACEHGRVGQKAAAFLYRIRTLLHLIQNRRGCPFRPFFTGFVLRRLFRSHVHFIDPYRH